MLKWNREKFKGFLIGACSIGLLSSVGTAFADGKLTTINVVQGGIKLFVDGQLVKPTDSDGRVVEPFIYDGTTYLPLRALSNALTNYQKPVRWDAATSSIYVGQAPNAAQTDFSELKPYGDTSSIVKTGQDAVFNILDKTITPFNLVNGGQSQTYMLHSNYSSIDGQFVVPYTNLGATTTGNVKFFNVDKQGKKTEMTSIKAKAGDEPTKVHVDLRGVEILEVQTYSNEHSDLGPYLDSPISRWKDDDQGVLYNVVLTGIN